ncbi:hypothetical protein GOP47_0023678 [Adiantum capillus-veneris]|uniref:Uncharacterized protein n=1 Tax=Adiantum capillus-veneris TaxID=13818 RepID=A0A9D4U540_ADICA|nr:hypothetical protein GOP47_0023678 [Adiantum capillus-veneris]
MISGYDVDSTMTFELQLPAKLYAFSPPELKELPQKAPSSNRAKEENTLTCDEETGKLIPSHEKENEEGKHVQGEKSGIDEDSHVNLPLQIKDQLLEENSAAQPRRKSQNPEVDSEGAKLNQTSTTSAGTVLNEDSKRSTGQNESGQVASSASQNTSQDASRHSVHEAAQEGNSFSVRALLYTKSNLNTFYVALEGSASGLIFECHIDMKEVMGVTKWHSIPIKCLQYSSSQQFIISGHDDGVVRVQTAPTPGQLSLMQQHVFWEGRPHDGFTGAVGGAMISFNHEYLVSAAYDGSFYVHELKLEKTKHMDIQMEDDKLDRGKDEVGDLGIGVYSIEEGRQKTEQDNKLRIALQNKSKLKEKVESIRSSIAELLEANNERDINERLPLEDFEVDPSIRSMIEVEIQSKVAEVKQELQWESEKKSTALAKLRKLFLDPLEVELILLHAFKTGACVATFRTEKIDPDLQLAINEANAQKERPPAPRVSVLTLLKDPEEVPRERNVATIDHDDPEEHHFKAQDSAALQDMRRLRLKKMVADYEKYIDGKQNMKFENEDDIAAIRYAENNMGDFKLKSNLEHVRPINQQTNAKKKRNEMLLLKEAVFKQKIEFNKEFLALRDIKMQISDQIHKKTAKIQEINYILRVKDEILYEPHPFKDEKPEERDHVSEKDIEEHCQNLKRIEEMQKAQEKKGLDFGGMSTKPKPDEKNVSLQPSGKRLSLDESSRKEVDKLQRANVSAQTRVFALSALEQEEQDAMQIKLKFQKSKLLKDIELMISSFDNALQELRHKRFQLEINIKRADLKMITLYQELKVLRTMQPKEEVLESRHAAKLAELVEISGKVSEQDNVLEQKKQELHALNEKKKQLMEEFEERLGENHPAKEALLKIYLRKVKLSKGVEDEDDENLDEDMDMDDSKGSEDDFDEDEVVEVCPPGCDQELYQKVCQLRGRRTVEDSFLQESNKLLDVAQREKESKLKKKKSIETALASLEKEMEDFQKEKQNCLNQIDAVLTLYMHQLEHLPDAKLPDDLSQALIFSNTVINELKETIKDHGTETAALKKLQKELKKEHITLVRERKSRESKIEDLEQRVTDVQMLKFGQIIDLEVLDTMSAKKDNDELKLQIKTQEAQNATEVANWIRLIDDSIDQIARAMKEHAACLHVSADLQESIQLLNKNMKQKAGSPYRDIFVEKKKAELEYDHLCKVVAVQKQRIEKLNQELKAIKDERRTVFP